MKKNSIAIIVPVILLFSSCNNEKKCTDLPTTQKTDTIFPKGEKVANNNFVGTVYLHPMITPDSVYNTQVGNVTFQPGARSNWHYHPGGQILLAIGGTGYYQEKGSTLKILRKGDVVKCPPNVLHWHGAGPDDQFIQVAITNAQYGPTVWLEKVSDEEYSSIKK